MAKLIYIDGQGRQLEYEVGPRRPKLTVGRASRCDVVIGDDTVSRHHCTIHWKMGGYLIEDHRSTSGTTLNGQWIDTAPLHGGDRFQCGEVVLHFVFDDDDNTVAGWAEASATPVPRGVLAATLSFRDHRGIPQTVALGPTRTSVTIGRLEDCVVRITDDSVSRHHARVRWHDDHWEVIDLESANGTFIGELQVERVMLCDGDLVRCGDAEFHFSCPEAGRLRRQLVASDSAVRPRPSGPSRRATADAQPAQPVFEAKPTIEARAAVASPAPLPFAPAVPDPEPLHTVPTPPLPIPASPHEQIEAVREEVLWLREQLAHSQQALAAAQQQIGWLQSHIEALQQELTWYRQRGQ